MKLPRVRVVTMRRDDDKRVRVFLVKSTEAGVRRSSHLLEEGRKVSSLVLALGKPLDPAAGQ